MEKFLKIKSLLIILEADAEKFYNKNNIAAGDRLRKNLQDLRNLAQAISFEIGNLMN